jgi:hypothetical protein
MSTQSKGRARERPPLLLFVTQHPPKKPGTRYASIIVD